MGSLSLLRPSRSLFRLFASRISLPRMSGGYIPCTLSSADGSSRRTNFYSRLDAVALLGPGSAYSMSLAPSATQSPFGVRKWWIADARHTVASALVSRYVPQVIFPYYIALASQLLAALYAFLIIPETLQARDQHGATDDGGGTEGGETTVAENLVSPIKPLALLLPHRDGRTGVFHWKLFFLTISLFTTTSGVCLPPSDLRLIIRIELMFASDRIRHYRFPPLPERQVQFHPGRRTSSPHL